MTPSLFCILCRRFRLLKNTFLVAAFAVLSAPITLAGDGRILTHVRPVPNSYIVVLKPLQTTADVENVSRQLATQFGVKLSKRNNDGRDSIFNYAFQGFSGEMSAAAALALAADTRVLLVEQNAYVSISPTQTFTEAEPHFNLDRVDQVGPVTPGNRSYTYETTGLGVYIYVLDTGVQRNHIEFDNDNDENTPQPSPRVLDGVNFASDPWPAYNPCGGYVNDYRAGTHGTTMSLP